MQSVTKRCSVLQCVVACCSVLQSSFDSGHLSIRVMQCVAVCCSVLQRVAACCCVLQSSSDPGRLSIQVYWSNFFLLVFKFWNSSSSCLCFFLSFFLSFKSRMCALCRDWLVYAHSSTLTTCSPKVGIESGCRQVNTLATCAHMLTIWALAHMPGLRSDSDTLRLIKTDCVAE